MRRGALRLAVPAAAAALLAGCGGGGSGVITVAAVETPQAGAGAVFHVPAGATVVHAGPGAVRAAIVRDGDRIRITLAPNHAGRQNVVTVSVRRGGRPVQGAGVHLDAGMLDMGMGVAAYRLAGPRHRGALPAWGMPGRWGLGFTITAPGSKPVRVVVIDAMGR